MDVDRPRQRNASDRQIRLMDAVGRETGKQGSDQRDEADDEAQANHSLTQT